MRDFIARRVNDVPPSGIRRFFDIAATMDDVISLGIGEPDFVTPKPILEAGVQSLRAGETGYTSNAGIFELRGAVAAYLERMYGVSYDPETEVLITVGVSEALHLALSAVVNPGDEVILHTPTFVSYQPEIIFAGGVPVTIQTKMEDSFQLMASDMTPRITSKTKSLLLGFPNNPTGAVMTRENMIALADLAKKHDLLVISDEIYDQLVYGGHKHVCFASLPGMRERTITLGGFSKSYAMTGWRIGYAAAPAPIHVRTDPLPGRRPAGASKRPGARTGYGRRIRSSETFDRIGIERAWLTHLRTPGRVLCLSLHRRLRHE